MGFFSGTRIGLMSICVQIGARSGLMSIFIQLCVRRGLMLIFVHVGVRSGHRQCLAHLCFVQVNFFKSAMLLTKIDTFSSNQLCFYDAVQVRIQYFYICPGGC